MHKLYIRLTNPVHFSFAFGVYNIVIKKEHYCPLVFGSGKGRIESMEIAFHILFTATNQKWDKYVISLTHSKKHIKTKAFSLQFALLVP